MIHTNVLQPKGGRTPERLSAVGTFQASKPLPQWSPQGYVRVCVSVAMEHQARQQQQDQQDWRGKLEAITVGSSRSRRLCCQRRCAIWSCHLIGLRVLTNIYLENSK